MRHFSSLFVGLPCCLVFLLTGCAVRQTTSATVITRLSDETTSLSDTADATDSSTTDTVQTDWVTTDSLVTTDGRTATTSLPTTADFSQTDDAPVTELNLTEPEVNSPNETNETNPNTQSSDELTTNLTTVVPTVTTTVPVTTTKAATTTTKAVTTTKPVTTTTVAKTTTQKPSGDHSFSITKVVKGTCTKAGTVTYTCSDCGSSYSVNTALGHDWVLQENVMEDYVYIWNSNNYMTALVYDIYACSRCKTSLKTNYRLFECDPDQLEYDSSLTNFADSTKGLFRIDWETQERTTSLETCPYVRLNSKKTDDATAAQHASHIWYCDDPSHAETGYTCLTFCQHLFLNEMIQEGHVDGCGKRGMDCPRVSSLVSCSYMNPYNGWTVTGFWKECPDSNYELQYCDRCGLIDAYHTEYDPGNPLGTQGIGTCYSHPGIQCYCELCGEYLMYGNCHHCTMPVDTPVSYCLYCGKAGAVKNDGTHGCPGNVWYKWGNTW
jgi:hypothetical protein